MTKYIYIYTRRYDVPLQLLSFTPSLCLSPSLFFLMHIFHGIYRLCMCRKNRVICRDISYIYIYIYIYIYNTVHDTLHTHTRLRMAMADVLLRPTAATAAALDIGA